MTIDKCLMTNEGILSIKYQPPRHDATKRDKLITKTQKQKR
jgi:hypothetical protein